MSQRTATALLAVLTLAVTEGAIQVRAQQPQAQQAQNEEIVRRAKFRVQPAFPELARKMNISGLVKEMSPFHFCRSFKQSARPDSTPIHSASAN